VPFGHSALRTEVANIGPVIGLPLFSRCISSRSANGRMTGTGTVWQPRPEGGGTDLRWSRPTLRDTHWTAAAVGCSCFTGFEGHADLLMEVQVGRSGPRYLVHPHAAKYSGK